MENPLSQKILKNLVFLCQNTGSLHNLLILLYEKYLISDEELSLIRHGAGTSHDQNRELYTILANRGPTPLGTNQSSPFELICGALEESGNAIIAYKLREEIEWADPTSFDPARMDIANRQRIARNVEIFAKRVQYVSVLFTHLEAAGVIEREERQRAMSMPCDHDRFVFLCFTLITKPNWTFSYFRNALGATGNNELVQILDKTPVTDQEEVELELQETFDQYYIDRRSFQLVRKDEYVWFDVDPPTKYFTGREDVLEALKSIISGQQKASEKGVSKMAVLKGLGGMGKTELARKYAYTHFHGSNVVWVNAETYETMADSFKRLAVSVLKLKLLSDASTGEKAYVQENITAVYKYFENRRCLFIFDNAENSSEEWNDGIGQFLPKILPNRRCPAILITSRNENWESSHITWDIISVEAFKPAESIEFLENNIEENAKDPQAIAELSDTLMGHPLALQQAVSYIKAAHRNSSFLNSRFGVQEYITLFNNNFKSYMSFVPFGNAVPDPYFKVTFSTWKTSVDRIRDEPVGNNALEILEICAYFNCRNISTRLFQELPGLEKQSYFIASIRLLVEHSLMGFKKGKLEVHSLVQQVTREHIKGIPDMETRVLATGLRILADTTPSSAEKIITNKIHFSHSTSAWEHGISYPKLLLDYNELFTLTALHLTFCGSTKKAKRFEEEGVKQLEKLGVDNVGVQQSLLKTQFTDLISSFVEGDLTTAAEKLKICVAGTKYMPRSDESTPSVQIARTFMDQIMNPCLSSSDQRKLAVDLLKDLASSPPPAKVDPEAFSNSDIFNLLNAAALAQNGRPDEALQAVEGVSSRIEKKTELSTAFNLLRAGLLQEAGRSGDALTAFSQTNAEYDASRADEKTDYVVQPENPIILNLRRTEAAALNDQGKFEEALALLRGILTKQQEILGHEALDTLSTQIDIGVTLSKMGQFDEALVGLQSTLKYSTRKHGVDSNITVSIKGALGLAYRGLKKYEEALEVMQDVYNHAVTVFGDDHPDTTDLAIAMTLVVDERDAQTKTMY